MTHQSISRTFGYGRLKIDDETYYPIEIGNRSIMFSDKATLRDLIKETVNTFCPDEK